MHFFLYHIYPNSGLNINIYTTNTKHDYYYYYDKFCIFLRRTFLPFLAHTIQQQQQQTMVKQLILCLMHCCVIYAPRSCGFSVWFGSLVVFYLQKFVSDDYCLRRSIVTVCSLDERSGTYGLCVFLCVFVWNFLMFFSLNARSGGMWDGYNDLWWTHVFFFYYISIKIPMTDIHLLHEISFLVASFLLYNTEAN